MRIIGIDPGLSCTGFGVIESSNNNLQVVDFGIIKTDAKDSLSKRLKTIYSDVKEIIENYSPSIMSIEDIFYGKNVKSALLLGHARSIPMVVSANYDMPLYEFSSRRIKQSLTGNGNATKDQVQFMVQKILLMSELPTPLDASDALAAAICYNQNFKNMIVFIDGVVINKALDRVTINVNGLGYECYISSTTFDSLPKEGKLVSLHTYLSISENNHTLFAFSSLDEKSLFQLLISVNGIGPKTAMPILSSSRIDDIKERISSGDAKMLSSLPGIGPKTANRIIVELKDKILDFSNSNPSISSDQSIVLDAVKALNLLGYKGINIKREVELIVSENNDIEIEQLIKETLKKVK